MVGAAQVLIFIAAVVIRIVAPGEAPAKPLTRPVTAALAASLETDSN
jgi:hypothetical protein